jgi:hypothetical protein
MNAEEVGKTKSRSGKARPVINRENTRLRQYEQ